jgi:hypothetical protein
MRKGNSEFAAHEGYADLRHAICKLGTENCELRTVFDIIRQGLEVVMNFPVGGAKVHNNL